MGGCSLQWGAFGRKKMDRHLNKDRNSGALVPPASAGPAFLQWPIVQTIRLQLRFLLPLVVVVIATAWLVLPIVDRVTLRWFARDLDSRGAVVANALSDSVVEAMRANRPHQLEKLFDRAVQDERLFAIGLCSPDGRMLERTPHRQVRQIGRPGVIGSIDLLEW